MLRTVVCLALSLSITPMSILGIKALAMTTVPTIAAAPAIAAAVPARPKIDPTVVKKATTGGISPTPLLHIYIQLPLNLFRLYRQHCLYT